MDSGVEQVIGPIQGQSVAFLTDFVANYWHILLTIGAVLFVGRWFLKLTGIGR